MTIGFKNTPQHSPYKDNKQDEQMFQPIQVEGQIFPKKDYLHIIAEVLFPREDRIGIGHVMACKHDAYENIMGRANMNSIIDTMMKRYNFLIANIIA